MELQYKNNIYKFVQSDFSGCWVSESSIKLDNNELIFEVYPNDFKNKLIKWDNIPEFFNFLDSNNRLSELHIKSKKILHSFFEIVGNYENIAKYRFELECVIYKGKHLSFSFDNEVFKYSFLYKSYYSDYMECVDPYGNYFIDLENGLITGCRREQI